MKTIILSRTIGALGLSVLAGFLSALPVNAQNEQTSEFDFDHVSCTGAPFEVRVVISNVKDAIGLMTTDLYNNDPDNFLKSEGRVLQKQVAAKAPVTKFCLYAPAAGDYAIAVYHDENANMDFDKGAFGLPAEPWGLSRNPRVRFGPPSIDKTLFNVTQQGINISVRLRGR